MAPEEARGTLISMIDKKRPCIFGYENSRRRIQVSSIFRTNEPKDGIVRRPPRFPRHMPRSGGSAGR